MSMQDPIADMLTRIRNANRVGRRMVMVKKSKICRGIADTLVNEGYIDSFEEVDDATGQGQLKVKLKYDLAGGRAIRDITRVSKPGRRVYSNVEDMPRVLAGLGITVVSTSKGVMSDRSAREHNVGGELLCRVN
jgi:small subunit ribosomal protein S8